jgi:Kef-type K+ transport system membrane component KefB
MTTLLRTVLFVSAAVLAAGLVLHLAGWPPGDRVIIGGLIALVSIPVVNTIGAIVEELRHAKVRNGQGRKSAARQAGSVDEP